MYISVIPLSHSLSTGWYIYSVSDIWRESISLGCLVEIPLGRNIVRGIVSEKDIALIPDIEIRPIVAVISSLALMTLPMISVVLYLSRRYSLPIHKVLSLFLPATLLSRLDKKNYLLSQDSHRGSLPKRNPKREIHHYIDAIFTPRSLDLYKKKGTVFILPDDFFLFSFFPQVREGTLSESIIYNESTPTKKSQNWIDIYEGKYAILAWTRRILYYNLEAYTHIIYIEDAFVSEQFHYPSRIRNMDILRAISDSTDLDITIITSSPTLSLLADFRDFTRISQRSEKSPPPWNPI